MYKQAYNRCKKCNKKFLKNQKIDGRIRRFHSRKFCSKCVPFRGVANQYTTEKPITKICINCNKRFKALIYIDGKKTEFYLRQHCTKCLPFKVNVNKQFSLEGKKIKCKRCKKEYIYRRGTSQDSTIKCRSCRKLDRAKVLKNKAIEYKGGKCKVCGFNRFVEALTFHHLKKYKKNFNIAQAVKRYGWEKIKQELDKCVLLCTICHAGVHAGHIKL